MITRPLDLRPGTVYKFTDGSIQEIIGARNGMLLYYYVIPGVARLHRSSRINNMDLMKKFNDGEIIKRLGV